MSLNGARPSSAWPWSSGHSPCRPRRLGASARRRRCRQQPAPKKGTGSGGSESTGHRLAFSISTSACSRSLSPLKLAETHSEPPPGPPLHSAGPSRLLLLQAQGQSLVPQRISRSLRSSALSRPLPGGLLGIVNLHLAMQQTLRLQIRLQVPGRNIGRKLPCLSVHLIRSSLACIRLMPPGTCHATWGHCVSKSQLLSESHHGSTKKHSAQVGSVNKCLSRCLHVCMLEWL